MLNLFDYGEVPFLAKSHPSYIYNYITDFLHWLYCVEQHLCSSSQAHNFKSCCDEPTKHRVAEKWKTRFRNVLLLTEGSSNSCQHYRGIPRSLLMTEHIKVIKNPTWSCPLQWCAAVCLSEEPPGLFLSPGLAANWDPSLNSSRWSSVSLTGSLTTVSPPLGFRSSCCFCLLPLSSLTLPLTGPRYKSTL